MRDGTGKTRGWLFPLTEFEKVDYTSHVLTLRSVVALGPIKRSGSQEY